MVRFKAPRKKARCYALRGKVFCGCCQHAMSRTSKKTPTFYCRHAQIDESACCHGLVITELELENMLYEILSKQAQIILSIDSLADAKPLDVQLAKKAEYDKLAVHCMDQKRILHERLLLHEISVDEYKSQRAEIYIELTRLKQIQAVVTAQTAQMQMSEKAKSAKIELAREITSADGLNAGLADVLIDRVYVHLGNQVDIIWKMKDFCVE